MYLTTVICCWVDVFASWLAGRVCGREHPENQETVILWAVQRVFFREPAFSILWTWHPSYDQNNSNHALLWYQASWYSTLSPIWTFMASSHASEIHLFPKLCRSSLSIILCKCYSCLLPHSWLIEGKWKAIISFHLNQSSADHHQDRASQRLQVFSISFMIICFSLTCGTTWHAAGLVGRLKMKPLLFELANRSARLYETLEEDTGLSTGRLLDIP